MSLSRHNGRTTTWFCALALVVSACGRAKRLEVADTLTSSLVLAELRFERSAELWLQAHSVADMRRFTDPYLSGAHDAVGAGGGKPVTVADVTASTFAMTGVPALAGRTMLPADERRRSRDLRGGLAARPMGGSPTRRHL